MGFTEGTIRGGSQKRAFCAACALVCFACRALPGAGKAAPSAGVSATSTASLAGSGVHTPIGPALVIGNDGPGSFTLRATRAVPIATIARLERHNADGTWSADPVPEGSPGYLLSESCSAAPPPACRSLVAGDTLLPVAWSGDNCAGQCGKPCWPYQFQSGTHRLVVSSCATPPEQFAGAPFEMPSTIQALARLRAASAITHVRAARVDFDRFELGAKALAPGQIAGLKEMRGTSHELDPELSAELLQWLRANDGFNDFVAKRCAPTVGAGFVLTREAANAGRTGQRTELSVDIGCRRLNLVQEGEELSSSYFDPSAEVLFGILRRIFPEDRGLKRAIER